MDDASLVRAFQHTADESAFETLVERHRQPTHRLILSIVGPAHAGAAEELTQDVFLKVFRTLDRFRGDARFSTWLYRIAYNQAVDYLARAHVARPHHGDEVLAMTATDRPGDNPFDTAQRGRTRAAVEACLDQLPHLYRSVLHQHYWLGHTVAEIGETLGAPPGTVKSYLHRGRARLHKLLASQGISDV